MNYRTDNTIKTSVPALLISIILLFSGTVTIAQPAEGEVMPELSLEEKKDRLASNFNAMVTVMIEYAKANDQTVEELGAFFGKSFAPSWSEDLTPKGLVEGMNNNWQMLGITTELLESSEEHVEGRHTLSYDEERFNEVYGSRASFDEYQQFFRKVITEIAASHGLEYEEYREGDWVHFSVASTAD